MIIFDKKRIIFLMTAVILPIGIFIAQNANNNINKNAEIMQTMAVPATSKTIVIDAGHGRRRWWSSK